MTEDTTAQLREQIEAALFPPVRKGQEAWEAVADAVMLVVLAQVEAAKATARREALIEGWERGFDDGERDVMEHDAGDWKSPCVENPYRASAQGVAAPAACSCACHGPGGNDWTHVNPCCPADPQRSGGQGAEGSGLNFTPEILQAHDEAMERIRESERAAFVTTRDAVMGAQSSGHEFVHCTMPNCPTMDGQEHCRVCDGPFESEVHTQRVPGQPGEQDTAEEPADG